MIESDLTKLANEKIAIVISEIDEELLRKKFDDPVDEVLEQFRCEPDYPIGHRQFNRIIANFIERLYTDALKKPWDAADPLDMAIAILDEHYQGLYAKGYTAAMMDVNDSENGGIYVVLAALGQAVKEIVRRIYIRAVFVLNIPVNDWHLQREMAGILLKRYRPYLPPHLKNAVPAQVVSQILTIIQNYTASVSTFEKISDSYRESQDV